MSSRRAVIAIRLTNETARTTSPVRQLNDCLSHCAAENWDVVGVAEDLDVSASRLAPWQRPALAQWLDDRSPEFDILVFWRLDRFVRSPSDLRVMIDWAAQHGNKQLVSATEAFDLRAPDGENAAMLAATYAQMESAAASQRVTSMRQHLLPTQRWAGGRPPYGYRTSQAGGERRLSVDPATAEVVREAASRVLAGESVNSIARSFTERGIPTPAARWRHNSESERSAWQPVTVRLLLTSPASLGLKAMRVPVPGKKYTVLTPVLDAADRPVQMAEPILSAAEFRKVATVLESRQHREEGPRQPRTPFLGVVRCGACGRNLQLHRVKKPRRDGSHRLVEKFRCRSSAGSRGCPGFAFTAEEVCVPLLEALRNTMGYWPVSRRTYVASGPGDDRWELEPLGPTLAERWSGADQATIAEDLRQAGVVYRCFPTDLGGHRLHVPADAAYRLSKIM